MRILLIVLAVVVALAAAGFGAAWWEDRNFSAPGPADQETTLIVKPGSSVRTVADSLAQARVVENAFLFRIGVLRRGQQAALKAGEYAFPAHVSMAEAMDMLVRHKVVVHRITIAEGLTSDMAVAIVNADPVLEGASVVVPEGSLLPETYLFERGTTRAEMLDRMHKAQVALLAELWPKRKQGLPFTTQDEALKLASIVEKETGLASERPRIAAVFVNRLKDGIRLESDPTIIYGLTKGQPLGHPLRQSELATPNPYSTYQIDGLPPTPICNPGRDAIAAVLNPPDSEELFFVANGTGGHAFAKTNAEHARNVAALRRLEREQAGAAPARLR
jgi:UPF0755 protein